MFPNKFTSWRNYEIIALMEEFDTDIFVYKGTTWAGIDFQIDYEYISQLTSLNKYKFLIFDPAYNFLQKYNSNFDGTIFNGRFPGSYLLTKGSDFILEDYKVIYHIFLGMLNRFNEDFGVVGSKQICHLYPGGGLGFQMNEKLNSEYTYVSTHPLTSDKCKRDGVEFIETYVTPQTMSNEAQFTKPKRKSPEKDELVVCFASLGYAKEKGAKKYVAISLLYKIFFPWHNVRFLGIGNCYDIFPIELIPPMDFKTLERFYFSEVDIQLNLMSKIATNGWPLGIEAVKQGAVLITSDPNRVAKRYFHGSNIQTAHHTHEFILRIRKMYLNRDELNLWREKGLEFFNYHCSFEKQQGKVINLIHERL